MLGLVIPVDVLMFLSWLFYNFIGAGTMTKYNYLFPVWYECYLEYIIVDLKDVLFFAIHSFFQDCYLAYILSEMSGSTMVFTHRCETTEVLALMLT